jgi:hypothetical protein
LIVSIAAILLAIALGYEAIWHGAGLRLLRPRWAAVMLACGGGVCFGLGATSILWFLATLAIPGVRVPLVLLVELAALGGLAFLMRRTGVPVAAGESKPSAWRSNWAAAGALALGAVIVTISLVPSWQANPQGNWDAWSIWNLRARYLTAPGPLAARAWSPMLVETHPEYPLLLSGTVARAWTLGSNQSAEVPIAIGLVFLLSLVAAATGAVAIARGPSSGLLTGLVLLCTPGITSLAPAQYADVPLAAFFVCAAGFALVDKPLWAGLFAGMAAWTKDEGLLFCVVLLTLLAVFRRRDLPRALLGAVPGALVVAVFKLLLSPQVSALGSSGTFGRLVDAQRYLPVLEGLVSSFWNLGVGWFHPVLPLLVYAFAVGLRKDDRSQQWLWTALAAAVLAGYTFVMLTTPQDLAWQIGTALDRLLAQWWPLAVIAVMTWLRSAEEAMPAVAVPAAAPRTREKRKRA